MKVGTIIRTESNEYYILAQVAPNNHKFIHLRTGNRASDVSHTREEMDSIGFARTLKNQFGNFDATDGPIKL